MRVIKNLKANVERKKYKAIMANLFNQAGCEKKKLRAQDEFGAMRLNV